MRGYAQAYERFRVAAGTHDPEPAFFALFEALDWAYALDDVIRLIWVPAGKPLNFEWRDLVQDGEIMSGVRFIRNVVQHQWADAIRWDGERWVWRAATELPSGGDQRLRPVYEELMEGRLVEDTLLTVSNVVGFVGHLLDPRGTPMPTAAFKTS